MEVEIQTMCRKWRIMLWCTRCVHGAYLLTGCCRTCNPQWHTIYWSITLHTFHKYIHTTNIHNSTRTTRQGHIQVTAQYIQSIYKQTQYIQNIQSTYQTDIQYSTHTTLLFGFATFRGRGSRGRGGTLAGHTGHPRGGLQQKLAAQRKLV